MKLPISLIILTRDEEVNIGKCLESVKDWVFEIFVVDSFSTDSTAQIAKGYGANVVVHPFENQAKQFNWALDNLKINNEWILRLDADEEMTKELWQEIAEKLDKMNYEIQNQYENTKVRNANDKINGFYMKRRVYFMGRWIKHGGYYPTWILRLFRNGRGRSEDREMDEHIVLTRGRAEKLENDFIDRNLKGLGFWINKHNTFATREANVVMKTLEHESMKTSGHENIKALKQDIEGPPALRREAKERYYRLPPFLRVFIYFFNRYFLRMGFLDGKEGFIFHILQGFWYRFLVDAKLYEAKKQKSTRAREHESKWL